MYGDLMAVFSWVYIFVMKVVKACKMHYRKIKDTQE